MPKISRSEVIKRAATMWPEGTVPYSQETIHPETGYRQDCSGYASMVWGIPPYASPGGWGGLNTVTLVTGGYMSEIHPSDLKPGDAVGICGPNTSGDSGHIVIFEKWANDDPNDDHYWLWEQAGGCYGPVHRMVNYPYNGAGGSWKAYRYRDITDDDPEGIASMTEIERTSYNADAWGCGLVELRAEVFVKTLAEGTISVPNRMAESIAVLHQKLDKVLAVLESLQGGARSTPAPMPPTVYTPIPVPTSPVRVREPDPNEDFRTLLTTLLSQLPPPR